ncbi:hypothetical protein D779_1954 [Imhoffiella purpurea]|uniref:Uncharacterized protein n=1 Tax=Imhoffiella purpurea TaxID=1249627 RepID=W9VX40_9GAMM|nr:hypothetical protein D779_1954 [Imhoffiella purpurea]
MLRRHRQCFPSFRLRGFPSSDASRFAPSAHGANVPHRE